MSAGPAAACATTALQPPSVLVSQLRDYLDGRLVGRRARRRAPPSIRCSRSAGATSPTAIAAAGCAGAVHPCARVARCPRSRRRRRRRCRSVAALQPVPDAGDTGEAAPVLGDRRSWRASCATRCRDFFRQRLAVVFAEEEEVVPDDETFVVGGLQQYRLLDALLEQVLDGIGAQHGADAVALDGAELDRWLSAPIEQLRLSGDLSIGRARRSPGAGTARHAAADAARWVGVRARHPVERPKLRLQFAADDLGIADWLTGVRASDRRRPSAACWLELTPTRWLGRASRREAAAAHRQAGARLDHQPARRRRRAAARRHSGRPRCDAARRGDRPAAAAADAARCCSQRVARRHGRAAAVAAQDRAGAGRGAQAGRRLRRRLRGARRGRSTIRAWRGVYPDFAALSRGRPLRASWPIGCTGRCCDWVAQHVRFELHAPAGAEVAG